MAKIYRLPQFPSVCRVMRGTLGGPWTAVYDGPSEKVIRAAAWHFAGIFIGTGINQLVAMIYFPAGTDVRGLLSSTGSDFIMWQRNPAWIYRVQWAENMAAGFANEFRACGCTQEFQTPTPMPRG
jgi:hypothetical protein